MPRLRRRICTQIVVLWWLSGCTTSPGEPAYPEPLARDVVAHHAALVHATYAASHAAVGRLATAVDALIAAPSAHNLGAARAAWQEAREPYRTSEVFRFYGGPIDALEVLINTWPIDESYVQAAAGEPAGILDDAATYPNLDEALLASLNAQGGETSISTGYHVIEFLLWGRDESLDGPGARPPSDFDGSERGKRRSVYLQRAVSLLGQHLARIEAAWAPGAHNYRAQFVAMPTREALSLVVRGMGGLSGPELRGERLTVAYETRDQENEHSCFSDTTHDDVLGNVRGIENVCTGRFGALEGPGLCALLDVYRPALGQTLRARIADSVAAAKSLVPPFDRALLGDDEGPERQAILRTMTALDAQTRALEDVARALDVGLGARASVP